MDLPRRSEVGNQVEGVRPIEDQLAEMLAEWPPDAGYDLVIVPVAAGVSDVWEHAERTDSDARRCADRASACSGRR